MDIIRTGIGLTKTIKNVARLREILSVFAKNGFDEFLFKSEIHLKVPGFVIPRSTKEKLSLQKQDTEDWWGSLGKGLRESFEELGPSFIKIGQLMATREDIIHPTVVAELRKLQNKVTPRPISNVKNVIKRSLKLDNFEEHFSFLEERPIAVASIAQVFKATLKSGEDVVIKVRKPGINRLIRTDFEIVRFILLQLERVSPDLKKLGATRVVDDFFKAIETELNLLVEAINCEKLRKNLAKIDKGEIFHLPTVYRDLSSSDVLVMEYLKGRPFNEIHSLDDLPKGFDQKLEKSISLFIRSLLLDGFFHADLHGGNFLLLEDERIGLLDFGLMGTLSRKGRENLVAILYALFNGDYENLVYEFLDVAEYEVIPNIDALSRDMRDTLSPFIGLTAQETNISELVVRIIRVLTTHKLYLPRDWFIIFRALMTLDGTGKLLGIDLDIYSMLQKDLEELTVDLFSKEKALEEAMWMGRDIVGSLRILPRHLRWFLKEFSKKNYAVDINIIGQEEFSLRFLRGLYFMGMMILASVFVLSGIYFVDSKDITSFGEIPIISMVCWGIAIGLVLRAHFEIKK